MKSLLQEDWVLCRVLYKIKQGENTSASSPISTPPQNTYKNIFKPNVTSSSSSSPNKNPNNNNITIPTPLQNNNTTLQKHSLVLPYEFHHPNITMPLNPNSVFNHFDALETTNIISTHVSIASVHDHSGDSDDDCLMFLLEQLKEDDEYNSMNIVSTLEDQLGFGLDDNNMIFSP